MAGSALQVRDVAKRYRMGEGSETSAALTRLLRPGRRRADGEETDLWALRDVTFDVDQGEVLGIVGHNGAGKSTLLKILARITDPTHGQIRMRGRMSALLEVGTAFHEELTGRENIWVNGAMLGLSRAHIRRHFDEIVEFAGVERFLDMPVKRYSSGMYLRLGFSVAAHLETDLMIVDEVLAVGDAEFQRRCLGKMHDLGDSGRTVIFVSHDANAVGRLCRRVLWLEHGRIREEGETARVLGNYLQRPVTEAHAVQLPRLEHEPAAVVEVEIVDAEGAPIDVVTHGDPLHVRARVEVRDRTPGREVALWVTNHEGVRVFDEAVLDVDALAGALETPGTYDLFLHVVPVLPPGDHVLGYWLGSSVDELVEREVLRFTVVPRLGDREFATPRRRAASPVATWEVKRL